MNTPVTTTTTDVRTRAGQQTQQGAPATEPAVKPERVPVGDVLKQIRQDAGQEPGRYLRETTVPHGGE